MIIFFLFSLSFLNSKLMIKHKQPILIDLYFRPLISPSAFLKVAKLAYFRYTIGVFGIQFCYIFSNSGFIFTFYKPKKCFLCSSSEIVFISSETRNVDLSFKLDSYSNIITLIIRKSFMPSEQFQILAYEQRQTLIFLENDN